MWRPKQKALYEVSGVVTPQVRLSHEEKGKMSACFVETVSREVTTTTMLSPNSGAVTPRVSLVLMSEATNGVPTTDLKVRMKFAPAKLEPKHHSMLN